ncbi:LysR family transcriptional regulator [Curvibacter microcysteis]
MTNAVFLLFDAFKALPMNLSWLDDFLALSATGNFSRAADERHMTQPAFGRRVKALEEWMGTDLFDRSSQPVRLTEAGLWFQQIAQDLLDQVARIPGEACAVAEANANVLKLAATHALSFSFVPGWLRQYESLTTQCTVQLGSDVLQRCEALLEQSKVQFCLCHAHAQVPGRLDLLGFASVQVGTDVLMPVSAPDANGKAIHPLQGEAGPVAWLSYSAESGLGRILRETRDLSQAKMATHTVFSAHLASVLRTLVLDGRGLAWLPQSLIKEDLAAGRMVPAAAALWSLELEIRLYRAQGVLGKAAESLWAEVSAGHVGSIAAAGEAPGPLSP